MKRGPMNLEVIMTALHTRMRRLMNYLDQRYNSTEYPIIVTENGISSKGNGTDQGSYNQLSIKKYF